MREKVLISTGGSGVTISPTKSPTLVGQVQEPTQRTNGTKAEATTIFLRADLTPLWIILGASLGICFLFCLFAIVCGLVWYNKKQSQGVNEVNDMLRVDAQSPVSVGDGGTDLTFAKQVARQEGENVAMTGSTGTISPYSGDGGITRTGSAEYSEDESDYGQTTLGAPGDENVVPQDIEMQIALPPEAYSVEMAMVGNNNFNQNNQQMNVLSDNDGDNDEQDNDMYQVHNIEDKMMVPGSYGADSNGNDQEDDQNDTIGMYGMNNMEVPGKSFDANSNGSDIGTTIGCVDDEYEYYYKDESDNDQEEIEMNEMYNKLRSTTKKGRERTEKIFKGHV